VVGALVAGAALAAVPIILWNSQHEWTSILYQIRDRHGDPEISWLRYARFWGAELLLAGPALVVFALISVAAAVRSQPSKELRFFAIWVLPALLVFGLQPLWSDFKPHWAFVIWWPAAILMAREAGLGGDWERAIRVQRIYGLVLGGLVLLACQLPIAGFLSAHFSRGPVEPRMDVTNDLYGWSEFRDWLALQPDAAGLPIVGSRYQTAAQAAFAAGADREWTLVPRDLKARDEWPALDAVDGTGPEWPRLRKPLLYVADNRYTEEPKFPEATCRALGTLEARRLGWVAKTISVWRCESSRP
jgi:4-amino-4-deoxy-L-arabinose transferase-like glycosyltransferase